MSYQEAEGSSTPEKPVLPSTGVNVLAIYTEFGWSSLSSVSASGFSPD